MFWRGRLGRGWSWACRPSPRREGQPRPKVSVSLLPWQRTPHYREPEKGWGEGAPRSLDLGTERGTETGRSTEKERVIYLCEDLPISEFSEPGTLWVLNKCPSETKMEPKRLKSPEMPEERKKNLRNGAGKRVPFLPFNLIPFRGALRALDPRTFPSLGPSGLPNPTNHPPQQLPEAIMFDPSTTFLPLYSSSLGPP